MNADKEIANTIVVSIVIVMIIMIIAMIGCPQ